MVQIGQVWRVVGAHSEHFVRIDGVDDSAGREVVHEQVPTRAGMVTITACSRSGMAPGTQFSLVNPKRFNGRRGGYALVPQE